MLPAISLASRADLIWQWKIVIQTDHTQNRPRVAASSYLNTAPLVWSFKHGLRRNELELVEAVPAQCAQLLANGEVEFALVPVIEYQQIDNVELVQQVCVGARERVRSVVLVSGLNNMHKFRSVALDNSSRTSAALVRIIFKEFLGFEPEWITAKPNLKQMLRENDAALLIGDPAMTFPRTGLHVFDLASLWRTHTGLGFVFAMWMKNASVHDDVIDFSAARDEGLAHIQDIIDVYEPLLSLPRNELREYLQQNISFSLDDELRAGLELFYKLAHKHGLIPSLKPLNL